MEPKRSACFHQMWLVLDNQQEPPEHSGVHLGLCEDFVLVNVDLLEGLHAARTSGHRIELHLKHYSGVGRDRAWVRQTTDD